MKRKIAKIICAINAIALNLYKVYATNPSDIYAIGNGSPLFNIGSKIAGYIFYIGIIAAVIVLMIKGMKFITASPDGKAEVKKEITPWVIGIVLLFSIRIFIQFFVDFAQNNVNNLTI